MTLQEAINFFENLITGTTKNSEIKVYEKFVYVLSKLKTRKFTKDEILTIETELDRFNINSNDENDIKLFKKAFSKFEKFLKHTFSLTLKGYYTNLGISLGTSFGIVFGIVFLASFERSLGIALGVIIGMVIGLLIGRYKDTKAINEDRVI